MEELHFNFYLFISHTKIQPLAHLQRQPNSKHTLNILWNIGWAWLIFSIFKTKVEIYMVLNRWGHFQILLQFCSRYLQLCERENVTIPHVWEEGLIDRRATNMLRCILDSKPANNLYILWCFWACFCYYVIKVWKKIKSWYTTILGRRGPSPIFVQGL